MKAPSKVTAFRQSSNNVMSNNVQQIQVSFRDFQANIQSLQCLFLRAEIKENIFSLIYSFQPFLQAPLLPQILVSNYQSILTEMCMYTVYLCALLPSYFHITSLSLSPKLKAA